MEVPSSENVSILKGHIVVEAPVADVSVGGAPEEVMHSMKGRPVLFADVIKGPNKDKNEEIVKFDENIFSAVEVFLHLNQVCEVTHFLRTIMLKHRERFFTSIRTHGFYYIHKLVVITPKQQVLNNGDNITPLFDGAGHSHTISRQKLQVLIVDGSHAVTVLMDLNGMGSISRIRENSLRFVFRI